MSKTLTKFNTLFEAPILNRSGYGEWSDTVAKMLIAYTRFDTLCVPCMWGLCQNRQVTTDDDKMIKDRIPKTKEIPQPHIYIGQTLPHLSAPQGTIFNMNISAGLEVDRCPDTIMNGVNQWDLNIVLSKFSKEVYENSNIKPTKPIEILPWGVDTNIFKPTTLPNAKVNEQLGRITEAEAFLFVGQNTSPHLFLDRKNISNLVRVFCETFKGKDRKPALILKTSGVNFSVYDRNTTIERIQSVRQMIPDNDINVYLLHGELSNVEMNALYNHPKIVASVSLTRGEGWGGPLLQASLSGKPVIAPNYSGHLEFLDSKHAILLDGKLETIPPAAESEYFLKDSKWFEVDYDKAKQALQDFYYSDRTEANTLAAQLGKENARKFNLEAMQRKFYSILDRYLIG